MVDGDFVPALPGQLLLQGEFDKSLHVMTGHNTDEGLLFTSPFVQTQADFITFLQLEFPTIQQGAIEYITEVLYPPVYDGTYGYTDAIGRNSLFHSEIFFSCNTNYLARAYNNETYGYLFAVPPGLHGQDIAWVAVWSCHRLPHYLQMPQLFLLQRSLAIHHERHSGHCSARLHYFFCRDW